MSILLDPIDTFAACDIFNSRVYGHEYFDFVHHYSKLVNRQWRCSFVVFSWNPSEKLKSNIITSSCIIEIL